MSRHTNDRKPTAAVRVGGHLEKSAFIDCVTEGFDDFIQVAPGGTLKDVRIEGHVHRPSPRQDEARSSPRRSRLVSFPEAPWKRK